MKPLRVMYFASTSEKSGGSLHSLVDLASSLKKRNEVEPFIILPDYGSGEELLKEHCLDYAVLKSYGSEWPLGSKKTLRQRLLHFRQRLENIKAIRQACSMVKERKTNLIHINTSVNEIGFYVARKTKTPFVWHVREFVKEGLGLEFYNSRRVYAHMRKADQVIVISNALYGTYSKILGEKKIVVIHNGIDPTRFGCSASRDDGPLRLVMVGRVSKLKGHYDVLEALSNLTEDFKLIVVGTPDENVHDFVAAKKLENKVVFVGYQNDVRPFLACSHIFISAHPWEAFGRAAVEAMMMGCLLIGVDNAGTKDLVVSGETGILYSMGNPAELSEILLRCSQNRKMLAQIARQGQEKAIRDFSLQTHCDAILNIYGQVCLNKIAGIK